MAASALPLSSSLSSAALRELVESAVESGEVAPLVKLAFEAGEPGGSGGDASGQQQREAEAGSALVNSVLELLTQVADDKEAEISQICRCTQEGGKDGMRTPLLPPPALPVRLLAFSHHFPRLPPQVQRC